MSTGYNCRFVRTTNDEWFYALQDWDCPVGAFDWRDYATAYGPFSNEDEAIDHLQANHANPGSWSTDDNPENEPLDATWDKLIRAALLRTTHDRAVRRW